MAEPLCPYFGTCGGCALQHIDYEQQLEQKKKLLSQSIHFEDITVFSGEPYHYRNRMDFIFHPHGIGLRQKKNWQTIIPIAQCVISEPKINTLVQEINRFFSTVDSFDVQKHTGAFRYAVIRVTQKESGVSFVLNSLSSRIKEAKEQIQEYSLQSSADHILVSFVDPKTDVSVSDDYFVVKGSDQLFETYLGKTFYYALQGFFQNNHAVAEQMQKYCHELLGKYPTKDAKLLDLYGGVGTFGIINASLFSSVTIVESVAPLIASAKKNMEINGIKNGVAVLLDAKNIIKLKIQGKLFVITDPPRSGMHPKTIIELRRMKPEVIVYVSCNIQQLAKDIPKFREYSLKSAALFDLFPQTPHGEAVVELVRK